MQFFLCLSYLPLGLVLLSSQVPDTVFDRLVLLLYLVVGTSPMGLNGLLREF